MVPPIKCQGIKTKLVDFVSQNLSWDGQGRWIEPFLGSGVVAFNVIPERAVLCDSNRHIVGLYQGIQRGEITGKTVRAHLEHEGQLLLEHGDSHYYRIRERFNATGSPLDFLFLNRSCFNGVMRFNQRGEFNVPFCRKPDRFRPALISKIVNQVDKAANILSERPWTFACQDWRETMVACQPGDFVYLDPPYIGRHTDYFNQWTESDAIHLAQVARELPCGFALSMWRKNKHRENTHLEHHWRGFEMRPISHFYHVGSTQDLRGEMEEVLVIKQGYAACECQ